MKHLKSSNLIAAVYTPLVLAVIVVLMSVSFGRSARASCRASFTDDRAICDTSLDKDVPGCRVQVRAEKPRAARVAVLNFGPPSSWQDEIGHVLGSQVTARSFAAAADLLQEDKIDVVVVRVNSHGGGTVAELQAFHAVFDDLYEKKFTTVLWIESAVSTSAMAIWVVDTVYVMPNAGLGWCTGCTGFTHDMNSTALETLIMTMDVASAKANRSPYIMRAVHMQEPLSCDIDEQGNVIWRQDEQGKHVLNPRGHVFWLTADDAVKFKFAKGKAATLEELMKVIGIQEWELGGKKASDYIDKSMRDADKAEKRLIETIQKYLQAVEYAESQQDKKRRAEFVGRAKRSLKEAENLYKANPNHAQQYRLTPDWFREQEKLLKKLLEP